MTLETNSRNPLGGLSQFLSNESKQNQNESISGETLLLDLLKHPEDQKKYFRGITVGVRLIISNEKLMKRIEGSLNGHHHKQFYIGIHRTTVNGGHIILVVGATHEGLADPILSKLCEEIMKVPVSIDFFAKSELYRNYRNRFKFLVEKKAYEIATLFGIKVAFDTAMVNGEMLSYAKSDFVHYDGFIDSFVDDVTGVQKFVVASSTSLISTQKSLLHPVSNNGYQFFMDCSSEKKPILYFSVISSPRRLLNYNITPYYIGKISTNIVRFAEVC